jgi:hypothetical protein
MRERR